MAKLKSRSEQKTNKEIETLKEQVIDLDNKWKRAVADYLNLEKRIEKEKQFFVLLANSQLLRNIIDLVDDIDRCSEHLNDQGLCLTRQKFHDLLKNEGVEQINPEAQEFNPEIMEAIEQVPGEKNKVVEVIDPGYKLAEKILRPAKVKVGVGDK